MRYNSKYGSAACTKPCGRRSGIIDVSLMGAAAYAIEQIHGKPMHPQTQGKIERYHRFMKVVVKLYHYYCPEELQYTIIQFVEYYNNKRYHESLNNLTPKDVYFGKGDKILKKREEIKLKSLYEKRKIFNKQFIV